MMVVFMFMAMFMSMVVARLQQQSANEINHQGGPARDSTSNRSGPAAAAFRSLVFPTSPLTLNQGAGFRIRFGGGSL